MKLRQYFILITFNIFLFCNIAHIDAIKFNEGLEGELTVKLDSVNRNILFNAGNKSYICNYDTSTYKCSTGEIGYFRNFIPFLSNDGNITSNCIKRIKVAMIFYGDKFKLTYLTDGTLIRETYIDSSTNPDSFNKKTGEFWLSSCLDNSIAVVKGITSIQGTPYFCDNKFMQEKSVKKNCPGYNPQLSNPRTEYKAQIDSHITGLNFFSIYFNKGTICLHSNCYSSKNKKFHKIFKKLSQQQENQIFYFSRIKLTSNFSDQHVSNSQYMFLEERKIESILDDDIEIETNVPTLLFFNDYDEMCVPLLDEHLPPIKSEFNICQYLYQKLKETCMCFEK